MIHIHGLDHIVLRTSNIEAMLTFYRDVLGCPIERELAPDIGLIQLRAGSALIDIVPIDSELGQLDGQAPQQDGRNIDHFCLQMTPVEEADLVHYLISHGIEVSEFAERYGAEGFGRSLYIQDPEGNVVELKPKK